MRKLFAFAAMVAAISMMACAGQQTKEDKEKDNDAVAKCELRAECEKDGDSCENCYLNGDCKKAECLKEGKCCAECDKRETCDEADCCKTDCDKECCQGCCECADEDDDIYGFVANNENDNGYSKITYYSSIPINKSDIKNILKIFLKISKRRFCLFFMDLKTKHIK